MAKGSPAGGTPGQPRTEDLTPSPPSGEAPGVIASSSAKRKATVQRDTLQESGGALKEKEEGKRPRRSAAKGIPRRTSARKAAAKLKKAKEAHR